MSYHLASRDRVREEGPPPPTTPKFAFRGVVGRSKVLLDVLEFATKVAQRRLSTVLLLGETGTGKELFARGIHHAGPDPGEPFVAVNCPAIPQALLESELFGHERGAFTDARSRKKGLLELAGRGTLLLDEIADLPADLQPKLLRALEERRVRRLGGFEEVDVRCRLIVASNRSLEEAVAEGKFREDLFYRLNVLRVTLPPLRERGGDLELLAGHFGRELAREQGIPVKNLTPEALEVLRRHNWPGNVRELRNVIHRAAILSTGVEIQAADIAISPRATTESMPLQPDTHRTIRIPPEGATLAELEAQAIRHTLGITQGNQSAACRILDISRPTLTRKIKAYGIVLKDLGRES